MEQGITRINDDFSTSPQLQPEQLPTLAADGFKSVINNRPDGEGGAAQPTSASIASAATSAGLEYAYLPVVAGKITTDELETFARLLERLPKPILGFCRTGNRAASLYRMAHEEIGSSVQSAAQSQSPSTGRSSS